MNANFVWDLNFQGARPERPNLRVTTTVRVQASSASDAILKGFAALEIAGWLTLTPNAPAIRRWRVGEEKTT